MRTYSLLITGFLCLIFSTYSQAQDLQKRINLQVEKAPLVEVLRQLQENYGIRFSYLNNDLAADTVYQLDVEEKVLSEVLDQLLEKSAAGYQQHNGLIIIKKGLPKNTPQKNPGQGKTTQVQPAAREQEIGGEQPVSKRTEKAEKAPDANQALAKVERVVGEEGPELPVTEKEAIENPAGAFETEESSSQTKRHTMEPAATAKTGLQENATARSTSGTDRNISEGNSSPSFQWFRNLFKPAGKRNTSVNKSGNKKVQVERSEKGNPMSLNPEEETSERADSVAPIHIGLFYPISTHGTRAPRITNQFSLHLLVGTAAGLEGVEVSSVGNIEKEYVHGYQFAGVFNVVGNEVEGLQASGFMNINGGNAKGGQFAGFLNTAGADVKGVQAAGFMNRAGGVMEGVQAAGFMNLAGDMVDGFQAAGFMNQSGGKLEGAQAAGFMNTADSVDGVQIAGFLNKGTDVEGVQISGFLNKARHVKGSQIGIINIADSVSGGVPIGLLSFVKNGYRRFEVYGGEDFQANLNFKIGVQKFHSIVALGMELDGNERSGLGFGFGSEWVLSQRFHLNTDILSYYINENNFDNYFDDFFDDQYVNNLNKIRVLASIQLSRRVALFGGPTYNVLVSRYQENPEGPIGSNLVETTFFNRTNRETNVKMWIGFNAGIRF